MLSLEGGFKVLTLSGHPITLQFAVTAHTCPKKKKKHTKRAQNVHASATVTVHFHTGIASKDLVTSVVRALDIKQDVVVKKG